MEKVIQKANVLIEALPYIQKFRGDIVVVKFGGSAMENPTIVENILEDVAFMECVGLCPVIVHGGGKAISAELKKQGLPATFLHGLRVTDKDTITVVERVLNRQVNPSLVATIKQHGCKARGIHGEDIIHTSQLQKNDPETGAMINWGHVGHIEEVDTEPIHAFIQSQIVPIITPLGMGDGKEIYNINADDVAAAVAEKLHARKLVFLSDVPGLLQDKDNPESIISTLRLNEVEELISKGIISGGMLPKIDGAVRALKSGVKKTHIIDSEMPHSLLLELFTDKGVGTEIVQ